MLNCSTNTNGNIQFRRNNFTSLANLVIIWNVACIHSSTRCTNGGTKFVRKLFQHLEIFATLQTSSASNYSARCRQVWAVRFAKFIRHPFS